MISQVTEKLPLVENICRQYEVRRLELFGSAATTEFNPAESDLDFLVEFEPVTAIGLFDRFFGLKEALESLFIRPVDLVEIKAIRNPYFVKVIQSSRVQIMKISLPR